MSDKKGNVFAGKTRKHYPDGVYRLTKDVDNPCVDRRHKHDWRLAKAVIKAGTEFEVRNEKIDLGIDVAADFIVQELCPKRERFRASHALRSTAKGEYGELFEAIYAHLEPVDERFGDWLLTSGENAKDLICLLLDAGKITLDDLKEVSANDQAEECREYDKRRKRHGL